MASAYYLNAIGSISAILFYTWLHPDLTKNVRLGFNQFKVNQSIYFGSFVWLFFSTCLIAPRFSHRTNALVGNAGMALCSIGVIVIHYLLETKWVWAGLLYICTILMYTCFMGMTLMGQNVRYNYDKNRLLKMIVPIFSTVVITIMCLSWMEETRYSDVLPWVAFNFFTIMAILAQVAAPRSAVFDFFAFLNRSKRENAQETTTPASRSSRSNQGKRKNR